MRLAPRIFACLLVVVVAVETSGVARAIGPAATVHCCCGAHASARPCPCPDCPVTLRRAAPKDVGDARIAADPGCDGHSAADPGVLTVLAVVAPLIAVVVPEPRAFVASYSRSSLHTRTLDVARPPP